MIFQSFSRDDITTFVLPIVLRNHKVIIEVINFLLWYLREGQFLHVVIHLIGHCLLFH